MTPPAVVLLSGGLDSTTALAHVLDLGGTVAGAVTVDYGQRHQRELLAAAEVAQHYGVTQLILDLRGWGRTVASALTDRSQAMPEGHYTDQSMAATVVPGRNAVLLSAAAGIAQTVGAGRVVIAAHAGDHPIYPDCRPDFLAHLSAALHVGYDVSVHAPFLDWDKTAIAHRAVGLAVPVDLTWSCYQGGDVHCGRCGTCVERAEALAATGADPTRYADPDFWRAVTA